ncbi:hypothetical protein TWF481_011940 [Arthrobotrys musiformis]|uniref:CHK kinase-like domain-containing protein n=1 Tax=Arthrobotrys musiformis TaxID=47236 RepID=A0AAV9W1N5_9PEZI
MLSILPPPYTLASSTQLCSLWSNYGSISRLQTSPPHKTSLILKSILPPFSEDSDPDESHLRKLISYRVERYFYTNLSPLITLPSTKVATAIAVDDPAGQLLLEDLSPSYPISCYGSLSLQETNAVLTWLAGFHATFWAPELSPLPIGTPVPPPLSATSPNTTSGIWQRGGYWYLPTRSAELSTLLSSSEETYLIKWLKHADNSLASTNKQWKTIIHGDVKGANIFLSSSSSNPNAALYDFQYLGLAPPTVDLIYFLGTTVHRSLLPSLPSLLQFYYSSLKDFYFQTHDGKNLEEETGYSYEILLQQWDLAAVDWMRFMAGWGVWGNWRWVREQAQAAVKKWEDEGRVPIE